MPPPRKAGRRTARSQQSQRRWLGLQESLAGRSFQYIAQVGELIQQRSLEPKEWLGGYAELWRNVIGDVGDWMLVRAGEPLRATDEWVRRFSIRIPKTQQTASISIEVPDEAFGSSQEITLVTDGLSRADQQVILRPDDQVTIHPQTISPSERRSVKVSFSRLQGLQSGVFSGMVCV